MPNKRKQKGSRIEKEIVDLHRKNGIKARKQPLSGALEKSLGKEFAGDVVITVAADKQLTGEVKSRRHGNGFRLLDKWLCDNDILFLRKDRSMPIVVIPFDVWLSLLQQTIEDIESQDNKDND